MRNTLFTDGGARGNPGPAAAGVVIKDASGNVIVELGMYLGSCTNNEAEYRALLLGLETAKKHNISELACFLDSELVVKQLKGLYRVKHPNLGTFFDKIKKLEPDFTYISYTHVLRSKNKEADMIVNQVLDAEDDE